MLKNIVWSVIHFTRTEFVFIWLSTKNNFFRRFIPRHTYYSSKKSIFIRNGIKFELDLSDYTQWRVYSIKEDWGAKLAYRNAKKNDYVVFDVGSNIGSFTFELVSFYLKDTSRRIKIHCFEPNPLIYRSLVRNLEINGFPGNIDVCPHNAGVGERESVLRLKVKAGHSGASSFLSADGVEGVEIAIVALDDFVRINEITEVDFIKIDVECFEPFVLRGGRHMIAKDLPVLLEHSVSCAANHGLGEDYIYKFMKELGCTIQADVGDKLEVINDFQVLKKMGKVNVFASAR